MVMKRRDDLILRIVSQLSHLGLLGDVSRGQPMLCCGVEEPK